MIEIKNVSKSFGDNNVLKGVSLKIDKGEKIVIMGPSGCGKSTLLRILATLENFEAGDIHIDKHELSNTKPISNSLSMVFQSFNLFPHKSVLENLTFAPIKIHKQDSSEIKKRSVELLNQLGLSEQIHQSPKTLSGGQKQRVAIARTLILDPPILLFDEPTSALDPEMTSEVLEAMEKLANLDKTILCVTHEVAFAKRFADKVAFFFEGELVFFGETLEFFNSTKPSISKFLKNISK